MARVLEMRRDRLYGDGRPQLQPRPAGAWQRPLWQRRGPPQAAPPPPSGGDAIGRSVKMAWLNLQHNVVDAAGQEVVAVGSRPAGRGHEMALRVYVGKVPEFEFGAYASAERRQSEAGVLRALASWALVEGAVRPTGAAGGGWTLECKWAGGRGTSQAALDIRPVGGPSSAAMQQLRQWMAAGSLRLPWSSSGSGQPVEVLVPCSACPGELPLGQVLVTLRGLPSSLMLKGTMAALLRAVGYSGLPGGGSKLLATEVFRGCHEDEPSLADGSLCAFVDQPMDDPELHRLPSTIYLDHSRAVVEVFVSSRRASFVSAPAAASPLPAQPASPAATQPPPPPGAPAQPRAAQPAAPAAAAAAPQAMATDAAEPADVATQGPMEGVEEAAAAEGAGVPGPGIGTPPAAAALLPESDALAAACVDRPAMARQLVEWATNSIGHVAKPGQVRGLLAGAAASSKVVRAQLALLAAMPGDTHLEQRPPVALELELVRAFARAGLSVATYEAPDGSRRSARLQPGAAAAAPRGRSPVARGSSGEGAQRRRSGRHSRQGGAGRGGRAASSSAGTDGRVSRSRSRGATSE